MAQGNAHIIKGIDAIINKGNTQPGFNFKELEHEMITGGIITKTKDPQDRFNDELREAASKLGISFGDYSKEKPSASSRPTGISTSYSKEYRPPARSLPNVSLDTVADFAPADDHKDEDDADDADDKPTYRDDGADANDERDDSVFEYKQYTQNRFQSDDRPKFGGDLRTKTQEQERRYHIDSIIGNNAIAPTFSFENEKREDMKCMMLADIDSLLSSLAESNIDLSRIPRVDRNSSFEEVESVLKMLRHKNDNARYCSFAEEFLIFGAYALEELFDGKRKWLGRYQPDLTGWHNHVNVKVSRMQHDTSKIVNELMQDYNIGPGARILLELIPSMVLYSKMRKQQHGEPGLFSDDSMADASASARGI